MPILMSALDSQRIFFILRFWLYCNSQLCERCVSRLRWGQSNILGKLCVLCKQCAPRPWFAGVGLTICVLWHNPQFCVMQHGIAAMHGKFEAFKFTTWQGPPVGLKHAKLGSVCGCFALQKQNLKKQKKIPLGNVCAAMVSNFHWCSSKHA